MRRAIGLMFAVLMGAGVLARSSQAAPTGLEKGSPDLKFAGPLAFGPENILFIGDPQSAAVFAVQIEDRGTGIGAGPIKIPAIDSKIAGLLGTSERDVRINDLAVNPSSGNAYLSVSRGQGPEALPVILRVNHEAKIEEVPLKDVPYAKASLADPASGKNRQESITHLAYLDGKLFISGLSNEEFSSRLRSIPFPFTNTEKGANIEIYHGSHGRFETNSPVRTFLNYQINGEAYLLAAYTCTPLVKIPVSELKPDAHVKGTTVAELGNRNRPLDMIVYQKDDKEYVLMANSSRGVMKISTDNIDKITGITSPVSGKAGLTYETIAGLKGVEQLDRLDKENALVLHRTNSGSLDLDTVPLP
jgi:hypothetical protein